MAELDVQFRCGCRGRVDVDAAMQPTCPTHGTRIQQAINPPAPRFVGAASGPQVQAKALPAIAVQLAPAPMRLKHPDETDPRLARKES